MEAKAIRRFQRGVQVGIRRQRTSLFGGHSGYGTIKKIRRRMEQAEHFFFLR